MRPTGRRILLVTGPASGGLKRHVGTLAAELPRLGFEVAAAAPKGVFSSAVTSFPLDVGDRPRPLSDLQAVHRLRHDLATWRPDVIHAQGVKAALLSLLASPAGRPPVLVTYHNVWHGGRLTPLLRVLAPRAAGSIAVSEAVRASLGSCRITAPGLTVIHNGVDPHTFPVAPTRPGDRPFTVLFMGRLTEEKGVLVLLAAAEELGVRSGIRLLIAGDGPLRGMVVERAGRSRGLTYLGQVEDVIAAYHGADLVVMPSLSEGLPMTALECMACGLPLVASRVGGLPEVLLDGETGLLVPPGDADALRVAIETLAADPSRAVRMGRSGRARIAEAYTEERMLRELVARYRRVLGDV